MNHYINKNIKYKLEEMTKNYLAYLLDDEFWTEINYDKKDNIYELYISNPNFFSLNELEDQLIPFLTVLNNEYDIESNITIECVIKDIFFTITQILEDDMGLFSKHRKHIAGININIKNPLK